MSLLSIPMSVPMLSSDPNSLEGGYVRSILDRCARQVGKIHYGAGLAVFTVERAFYPRASALQNAAALEALMTALYLIDEVYLGFRPWTPPLYRSGVIYRRTRVWDTTPALYGRQYGDCKSLTAERVAEIRRNGGQARPFFRFKKDSKCTLFHILVLHGNGQWEDPSKILGMPSVQENPWTSVYDAFPGMSRQPCY